MKLPCLRLLKINTNRLELYLDRKQGMSLDIIEWSFSNMYNYLE